MNRVAHGKQNWVSRETSTAHLSRKRTPALQLKTATPPFSEEHYSVLPFSSPQDAALAIPTHFLYALREDHQVIKFVSCSRVTTKKRL